eukprot:scaffold98419_cov17-Tisochrysis_lutea.AAC.1
MEPRLSVQLWGACTRGTKGGCERRTMSSNHVLRQSKGLSIMGQTEGVRKGATHRCQARSIVLHLRVCTM